MNPRIERHRTILTDLCRRHHVRRLEVFGSAAADAELRAGSDFDFLVELEELPPDGYADAYFRLLESREDLFERPVDLVVDSAIRNPYFRESLDQARSLVVSPRPTPQQQNEPPCLSSANQREI